MSAQQSGGNLLMLIDGHSMAFRAFHALPDSLRTPQGEPIQAVYGFISMLLTLLETWQPRSLAVAFDEGLPFRHELYPHYKAGRETVPPEVEQQIAHLRGLLEAFTVVQVAGEPFEADDYLATLTRMAATEGHEVLVVSGDRDLFQLVGPQVRVLYPGGRGIRESVIYDEAAVTTRYGVSPAQLTDWKALVGDSSDNIPGVRGIGEKSATGLLQRFGSLDAIYAQLPEVTPPGLRAKLEAGREQAQLSHALSALRFDAPITCALAELEFRYPHEPVEAAMRTLGFDKTIARLPAAYRR